MLPDKDIINEMFGIVQNLNDAERELIKEESKKSYFRGEKMIFGLPIASFIVALVFAIVSNWFDFKFVLQISRIALIISYLSIILGQTTILPIKLWTWRKRIANPLGSIIDTIRKYAETDVDIVKDLYKRETDDLKYMLTQLKAERSAWERRVGMLVGALEKVGIIPGLAALIAIYMRPEITKPLTGWVAGIAYGIPGVYIIGMWSHLHMSRLDRFIMLIEMVIEAKKSALPAQSLSNDQQLLPLGVGLYRNPIL